MAKKSLKDYVGTKGKVSLQKGADISYSGPMSDAYRAQAKNTMETKGKAMEKRYPTDPNVQKRVADRKAADPAASTIAAIMANPSGYANWYYTPRVGRYGNAPDTTTAEKGLYDDMIASLKSRLASDPAAIQAIYSKLADQIASREAGIASRYDEAANMLTRTGNEGIAGTNAMYQSVRDANTAQMKALGIEEALGTTGGRLEAQQQQAGNFINQLLAAEQARNVGYRQAAMTAQQGAALGAGLQGVTAATARARALQDQISQLGIENTQYANQLELDRAKTAADIAAQEAKAGTPVDFSAVLDAVLQRYPDIDPKQAIDIAQSQVKYG